MSIQAPTLRTTTTKRGARGETANQNRKVGQKLIALGDRIIRKAGQVFEIPKSTMGKLIFQLLTGAKPVGRGEWARVSAEEINREELGQMIAALSAIYLALPKSAADENPVAAKLLSLGFDEKYARQIAAESFYTVAYIDAHWADVKADQKVDNPLGLLRFRLNNRIPVKVQQSDADRFKYDGWDS
jgi:hypothetical protein